MTDHVDGVCSIEKVSESDATDFLVLQDAWAECHLDLARPYYPALTMRDWQLLLCCPSPKILDSPKGRVGIFKAIVQGKAIYSDITILKAVIRPGETSDEEMIGFVMYERMDFPTGSTTSSSSSSATLQRTKSSSVGMDWTSESEFASTESGGGAAASTEDRPWLQVKQLYVDPAHRHRGLGRQLLKAVLEAHCELGYLDIRLQVVDLNIAALEWYRALGFLVSELSRRFLGDNSQGNIVVYKKMILRAQPAIRSFGPPGAPLPRRSRTSLKSGDPMSPCEDETVVKAILAEALPFATASEAVWAAQKAAAASNKVVTAVPQKILTSATAASAVGDLSKSLQLPLLFRQEILGEVVTINYPDGSGAFKVRVAAWDSVNKWHKVTSDGLSTWDDQNFDDEVDLNVYYRSGHAVFQRTLSTIHRAEWARKRSIRQAQAEQRAKLVREKEKEERALMEVALASDGPLTRSRRKVMVANSQKPKAASTAKRSSFPSPPPEPSPSKKPRPAAAKAKGASKARGGGGGDAGGAAPAVVAAAAAAASSSAAARAANARAARLSNRSIPTTAAAKPAGVPPPRDDSEASTVEAAPPAKKQRVMTSANSSSSGNNSIGNLQAQQPQQLQQQRQQQPLSNFFRPQRNDPQASMSQDDSVVAIGEDIDFSNLVLPAQVVDLDVDATFAEQSRGTGPAPLGLHFDFEAHASAFGNGLEMAASAAAAASRHQARPPPATSLVCGGHANTFSSGSFGFSSSSSLSLSSPACVAEQLSTPSRVSTRNRKGSVAPASHTSKHGGLRRRPSSPEKLSDGTAKLRPPHVSQKLMSGFVPP